VEVALEGLEHFVKAGAVSVVHPTVKKVFARYDKDTSGALSRAELKAALGDLGSYTI